MKRGVLWQPRMGCVVTEQLCPVGGLFRGRGSLSEHKPFLIEIYFSPSTLRKWFRSALVNGPQLVLKVHVGFTNRI